MIKLICDRCKKEKIMENSYPSFAGFYNSVEDSHDDNSDIRASYNIIRTMVASPARFVRDMQVINLCPDCEKVLDVWLGFSE